MAQETNSTPRKKLLIAAAATALTVATGVTAAALLGVIRAPGRDAPAGPPAPEIASAAVDADRATAAVFEPAPARSGWDDDHDDHDDHHDRGDHHDRHDHHDRGDHHEEHDDD